MLDVRNTLEKSNGYIKKSLNISLWELEKALLQNKNIINKNKTTYVSC